MAGLTAKARIVEVDKSDEAEFLRALARDILAMNIGATS
jgi:hypothetical protein